MSRGLFKTIFDEKGVYNALYRREGGSQPMKSTDQRLGSTDDAGPSKKSVFAKEYKGFPMWLIGVFLLGFAYTYRKRKKESNVS